MPKKILVVDDERSIAEILGERLMDSGYEVVFAYDGPSVFDVVGTENPDLILMDYALPRMNGDVVCAKLKNDQAFAHIPIILLSAYRKDFMTEPLRADFFLGKPYDAEELLAAIEAILNKASS